MFKRTRQTIRFLVHIGQGRYSRRRVAEPQTRHPFGNQATTGSNSPSAAARLRFILIPTLLMTLALLCATGRSVQADVLEYPADPPHDIDWAADIMAWREVAGAFNYGRQQESALLGTTLPELVLPAEETWAAMGNGEKALWLINAERTARGLVPLQGLEENVSMVAQAYADWLLANNAFAHDADGRSPWERLHDNAVIGACHDFLGIAENLSFSATTLPEPELYMIEESIYRMMYADADSAWGHRHAMLWSAYTENSGAPESEGFLGIGFAQGGYTYNGNYFQNTNILVMNFFDPCAAWNDTASQPPPASPTPLPTATSQPTPSPPTPSPTPEPSPMPTRTPTPTPVQAAPTRSVSGQVTVPPVVAIPAEGNALEQIPLPGVLVTSDSGMTTVTDADGWFTLDGLAPGMYTLTFSKEGYAFVPSFVVVDLTTDNVLSLDIDGESEASGTQLNYEMHLPFIRPD